MKGVFMFSWQRNTVKILNDQIQTDQIPTIQAAQLVHIQGEGALTTCSGSIDDPYYGKRFLTHITLNNIPLIQINSPGCPTSSSILSTGYGIENADCKELAHIQSALNAPFVSLDASIKTLTPLLALLTSGLYLIADAECYPTDGNGNFFWSIPNEPAETPATAAIFLPDSDYAYISGQPVYLYPTQNTDCYNDDRVNYYIDLFQKTNFHPRAVVYCFSEFISFILDGHHKACAAAILKRPLRSILIIPLSGHQYKKQNGQPVLDSLLFSSIKIPVDMIPKKYLPTPSAKWIEHSIPITPGIISRRNWEGKYTESADCYPSVLEYANIIAAGLPVNVPLSDKLIADCLNDLNQSNLQKMSAVLSILLYQKDSRLKHTAMLCAEKAPPCELKRTAYKILAKIKSDPEIEQFFIDYLVECEDKHDMILPIIDTYWK